LAVIFVEIWSWFSFKIMVKLFLFSVLCAVFSLSCGSDVIVLTDEDFNARLASYDLALVKFFAPWCGHCKKLAPEFEKAATILKDNDPPVFLAEVDCTEGGKDSCSKHGVNGYPTLKAFKKGEKAFEYDGPRDADGIVKYMRSKAGPSSKLLNSVADATTFVSNPEHSIVGFFSSPESELSHQFQKLADSLSENFRFAHTYDAAVHAEYGFSDDIVIFQPTRLQTKLEPAQLKFTGDYTVLYKLKDWVTNNVHGLAGHRTTANVAQFKTPFVVVYYDVDYSKNVKGTNYWRNRVIKVAKKLADEGKKLTFAVSNAKDFAAELNEYALTFSGEKGLPVVAARDAKNQKFVMQSEFSVENLEKFAYDVLEGKLEPYLKSEPVPSSNDEPVKVVVAKTFNEIVNDVNKDVLIEFYAPWCGHCKSLAPKYEELAKKLQGEDSIVIAKMDATANDVPKQYEVRGFPTIYFSPKGSKDNPRKYEGQREVDDFIKYLARQSTDPLKNYTRDGQKVKPPKKSKDADKVEL
jgi:protein disulfide isomerase family A protein 3